MAKHTLIFAPLTVKVNISLPQETVQAHSRTATFYADATGHQSAQPSVLMSLKLLDATLMEIFTPMSVEQIAFQLEVSY